MKRLILSFLLLALASVLNAQSYGGYLIGGSYALDTRQYQSAIAQFKSARELMEKDTSTISSRDWWQLWIRGGDAAWMSGDKKLAQEFYNKYTTTDLKLLNDKIAQLKSKGIKHLFTYYTYNQGGILGTSFIGPGPHPCVSNLSKYLVWVDQDKTYIQLFDECKSYEAKVSSDPDLAAFYKKYLDTMVNEKISHFGYQGHHMNEYEIVFHTVNDGIWKKYFNAAYDLTPPKYTPKQLENEQLKGSPEMYKANISTQLSKFFALLQYPLHDYDRAIDTTKNRPAITWGKTVVINNEPIVVNTQPTHEDRTNYSSEYCRLLKIKEKTWLAAYTVSRNKGYMANPSGGLELEIARSTDNGQTWRPISLISDPGRDLDNAELTLLKDGSIVLACRSVRWQESYRLPVYKSSNKGVSWTKVSTIDANEGEPGELGKPDKGVYDPHILQMDNGDLSVLYANEKHVTEPDRLPQIISQKISTDMGKSWGEERMIVYKKGSDTSRPGMPVFTRMKNGEYILVYEICGSEACTVYYKTSPDGLQWPAGLGNYLLGFQIGGPFVLSLSDGRLVVTSNTGYISFSPDYGKTWNNTAVPWKQAVLYSVDWTQTIWSSLYQFGPNEIAIATSIKRPGGGHNIQLRFGKVSP
ncbi:MAG: sialidase family protein [Bacteroidota bacterium]